MTECEDKIILPHHEQQSLCTTRLPYRQGRKLTAVKVYTINEESRHLLVFGVPALNLRQEAKQLFMKFGKINQFTISTRHPSEKFTETYHLIYDCIKSARVAKKFLDTRNFYGGSLHICYAPEYETIQDLRHKLEQRRTDVLNRLRNLNKETNKVIISEKDNLSENLVLNVETEKPSSSNIQLNMGKKNTIILNPTLKRKLQKNEGRMKKEFQNKKQSKIFNNLIENTCKNNDIDIIDFTSTSHDIITNLTNNISHNDTISKTENITAICVNDVDNKIVIDINKKLSDIKPEQIKKVELKPMNKITFHVKRKKL